MNFWERTDSLMTSTVNRKSITKDLSIAPNSFSTCAKRKTYPAADIAVEIARKLETTVEYLVTGESAAAWGSQEFAHIFDDLKALDDTGIDAVALLASGYASRARAKPASGDG
jgi:hypothetical protein